MTHSTHLHTYTMCSFSPIEVGKDRFRIFDFVCGLLAGLSARSNLGHIYRTFTKGQKLPESGDMQAVADTFTISADSYFGREIEGIILPSPSSNARRGEWRTPWYTAMHDENPDITFDEGRVLMYRKALAKYFS